MIKSCLVAGIHTVGGCSSNNQFCPQIYKDESLSMLSFSRINCRKFCDARDIKHIILVRGRVSRKWVWLWAGSIKRRRRVGEGNSHILTESAILRLNKDNNKRLKDTTCSEGWPRRGKKRSPRPLACSLQWKHWTRLMAVFQMKFRILRSK